MKLLPLLMIAVLVTLTTAHARQHEQAVTDALAAGGYFAAGETLADKSRCDLSSATHAVEVDYAPKWAEAIGQALHYARLTQKRAGVVLIVRKPADMAHVQKVVAVAAYYALPLDVWTTDAHGKKLDAVVLPPE